MRIVHLSTADTAGGAFVAAQRLVAAQQAAGLDAKLVVGTRALDAPYITVVGQGALGPLLPLARKAAEALLLLHDLKNWRRDRFQFAATRMGVSVSDGRLAELIHAADVIHLHWTHHGFLSMGGLEALAGLGKPVVWTLHDRWVLTGGCLHPGTCTHYLEHCGRCPMLAHPADDDLSARRWQQKSTLYARLQPHFVAVSAWLVDEVRRAPLTQLYRVDHIPNPLDTDTFAPRASAEARVAFGLDPKAPIALFVARSLQDHRKGLADLCKALLGLPDVQLVTVGEGTLPDAYQGRLRHHAFAPVTDTVALAQFYAAADVFCIPSHEESLGYTALEAQASGRPVVGYRTGGIPEVVRDGETGLLAPTGDVNALRLALGSLLNDSVRRRQMGVAGRRVVLERYSSAGVAEQYRTLYAGRLGEKRRAIT